MTSGAEAYFLAAGQAHAEPAKKSRPAGRKPNLRPCPLCGGLIAVPEGQPFPPHGEYRMTKTGIRETGEPCDLPEGTLATRTTKEN